MDTTLPFRPRPSHHTANTLTDREQQIVHLVAEASTNRDIARALGISEETVKRHMTNILDKTGMGTRLELAVQHLHHFYGAQLQAA